MSAKFSTMTFNDNVKNDRLPKEDPNYQPKRRRYLERHGSDGEARTDDEMEQAPMKRRPMSTTIHGATSQRTAIFILVNVGA